MNECHLFFFAKQLSTPNLNDGTVKVVQKLSAHGITIQDSDFFTQQVYHGHGHGLTQNWKISIVFCSHENSAITEQKFRSNQKINSLPPPPPENLTETNQKFRSNQKSTLRGNRAQF